MGLDTKHNHISKDVREQLKWLCLSFAKHRDSFEDCLRENDVVPDKTKGIDCKSVCKLSHIQNLFLNGFNRLAIICYKFVKICYSGSYNFVKIYYSASYIAS